MQSFVRRVCVCQAKLRLICKHTRASSLCLSCDYVSPLKLEKLWTLLSVFTFILKNEAHKYEKGRYLSDTACGVRPITVHCASWPIRADSLVGRKDFVENKVFERGGA